MTALHIMPLSICKFRETERHNFLIDVRTITLTPLPCNRMTVKVRNASVNPVCYVTEYTFGKLVCIKVILDTIGTKLLWNIKLVKLIVLEYQVYQISERSQQRCTARSNYVVSKSKHL
jgi:hypothetical protein